MMFVVRSMLFFQSSLSTRARARRMDSMIWRVCERERREGRGERGVVKKGEEGGGGTEQLTNHKL